MSKNNIRLTFYDRQRIEYYLHFKRLSIREIAKLINKNHSVISREIIRHKPQLISYNAELAQLAADRKKRNTNKRKLDKDESLKEYVINSLKKDWSPEEIAGRLKNHPPPEFRGKYINHESIYQYIYEVDEHLFHYLRKKHYHRTKKHERAAKKINIPDRVSIHDREEDINKRIVFGHWESDSMLSGRRSALSVQYERKSRFVFINRLIDHKSETTMDIIQRNIESLPIDLWQSITFDNGFENTNHLILKENYQISTYFCDPYASYQKGGVENTNGLIRQYISKKCSKELLTDKYIKEIQEKLNNRPRKCLNYQTPNEIIKTLSGALNS